MRKLILLIFTLILGASASWADDIIVTLNDQTDLADITDASTSETTATHKYGVYSGSTTADTPYYTTFTSNWTSGLEGVTVSTTSKILKPTYVPSSYSDYQHVMAIFYDRTDNTTVHTFTISAPSGYKIKSYSFYAISTSDGGGFTVNGNTVRGASEPKTISANVNATTADFTVKRNTNNNASTLCIPRFTVTLEKIFPFTYTVNDDKGTFYSGSTVKESGYGNKWLSKDTDAQLALTTNSGNNNMVINVKLNSPKEDVATPFRIHTDTYNLAVPFGYIITGWSITGYTNYTSVASTIKGTTISTNSASPTTVSASSLISRTASFAVSTASPWITVNSMTVTIAKDSKTYIDDLSNLSNTKSYIIYGERGCWNTASADATSMTYVGTNDINKDDTKQQIALISGTQGRIYAYSVTAGKFLNGSATNGNPIGLSDTPEPIYISSTGNSNYPWFFSFTDDKSAQNINISSSALKLMTNSTLDEGNRWCICEANTSYSVPAAATSAISTYETEYASVTYKLKYNGNVVATVEHPEEAVGTTVSASTLFGAFSEPEYASYDTPDVTTIAANTTEVNINITWTGPFDISTSYAEATWYYLKLKGEYLAYSTTAPYQFYTQEDAVATADKALWAFVGDPYNGVRVMNYAAGDGTYLNMSSTVQMASGSYPQYSLCRIHKNSSGGFALENDSYYYYNNGTNLVYGNSDWRNTEAAAFSVESVTWKNVALAKLTLFATEQHMGEYFGVTETAITGTRGYINDGTIASATRANYDAIVEYLYGTVALSVEKPTTGYYRIYNATRGRYLGTDDGTPKTLDSNTSASTIVRLVYDDVNKKYKIQMQGKELVTNAWNKAMSLSDSGTEFTAEGTAGVAAFKDGSSNYVHAGSYNASPAYKILSYSGPASDAASGWTVTDATTFSGALTNAKDNTATENSYATLCVPFAISALTGANAYMPTKDGDYIVPGSAATVSDGTLIPAGTPVILVGAKDAGTYTATIKSDTAPVASPLTSNVLTGTFTSATIDTRTTSTNYVLGFDEDNDNRIGFYHVDNENFPLSANRAYLNTSGNEVKGFMISFDVDEETAINSIENGKLKIENEAVYDLSGRRIAKPTRGLYIVNGKKVVIK